MADHLAVGRLPPAATLAPCPSPHLLDPLSQLAQQVKEKLQILQRCTDQQNQS
jgi:hypothetical protein